jgi:hypothetical protein
MTHLELFKLMDSKNPKTKLKNLLIKGLNPNIVVEFQDKEDKKNNFSTTLFYAILISLIDKKEFNKLKPSLDLLLKEGADINVPEVYTYSKALMENILKDKVIPLNYMIDNGLSLNSMLDNKPLIDYISCTYPNELYYFYPFYQKIIWKNVSKEIEQQMKEGFDNFLLKEKLSTRLLNQESGKKIKL